MNMNVEGKRVLVCGMARSGIAAAKLLISLGACCLLYTSPLTAIPNGG